MRMNKKEATKELINKIYKTNSDLILNENEIKKINIFFKENNEFNGNFDDFFEKHYDELKNISLLKSGKYEIEKQYNSSKSLQSGILSECNYIETLAKIFKLNKCLDFDKTPINKIPLECRKFLNSGYQTYSAARYLYYSTKNPNIFLFQYGNPADGDAEIIIFENKIRLEFKERNAKAGEYDITGLYDENGKLLISDDFKKNTPEFVPLIEKFNNETNIIDEIGHNYNNFDEKTIILSIQEYFLRHNIDVIVSSTSNNELIILTPDCINVELPNGKKIITTDNSEIRTSGRNYTKIFTMNFFNEILKKINAFKVDDNKYRVSLDNDLIEIVNARGSNKPSRIKFNKIFFVNIDNIEKYGNEIIFNIDDVKQLKPSISMHIKINVSKEELKKFFDIV